MQILTLSLSKGEVNNAVGQAAVSAFGQAATSSIAEAIWRTTARTTFSS